MKLMRYIVMLVVFIAATLPAAEITIPNQSPNGWTPGANTGTGIIGKIDKYRPGGASERTVLRDAIAAGADASGTNDCNAAVTSLLSTVGAGEVAYFGYGVFKIASRVYSPLKNNFTYRGAGSGVRGTTTSPVAIASSGTVTFNVPAGLGWTPGVGCRVNVRNAEAKWMQGLVVSYNGTALDVSMSQCAAAFAGESSTDWMVSQTHISYTGTNYGPFGITAGENIGTYLSLSGSYSVGDTVLTTTTPPGASFAAGKIVKITRLPGDYTFDSKYQVRTNQMINVIESVVGSTITLKIPLVFDMPEASAAKVAPLAYVTTLVGIEDMSISCDATNVSNLLDINSCYQCWVYNVRLFPYFIAVSMSSSVQCELNRVVCNNLQNVAAVGVLYPNFSTNCLVQHCIFQGDSGGAGGGLSMYGGSGYAGCAFLYNLWGDSVVNLSHYGGLIYNLFQYNIGPKTQLDGFHGHTLYQTQFRNWWTGRGTTFGWIVVNRRNYFANNVGNLLGVPGERGGGISYGNPYMGSGGNSGTTANVVAYVEGGRSNAALLPLQLDETGEPRITGVVTGTTNTSVTIEIQGGHTMADFQVPNNNTNTDPGYLLMAIRWGGVEEGFVRDMSFSNSVSSGTTLVLNGGYLVNGVLASGADYPPVTTTVRLHLFAGGLAELDQACEYSATDKHNLKAFATGGSFIDKPLAVGETLPDSLAGTPDWPSSITFPPWHPDTGVPASYAVLPIGYYYLNGEWPTDSSVGEPTVSVESGTYDTTPLSVTITAAPGTTAYYTTDNSTPDNTDTEASGPITFNTAGFNYLKVVGYVAGEYSSVRAYTYRLRAASPTFLPVAGAYDAAQSVTIASTTNGTTYHYTTNGNDPTTDDPSSPNPVNIESTTTLKAIAVKAGLEDSAVASGTYNITIQSVATPTFNPVQGAYVGTQNVEILCSTQDATIRYTLDGVTEPSSTVGSLYAGPIPVSDTTTIKAIAYNGVAEDSAIASATFTITPSEGGPTMNVGTLNVGNMVLPP